MLLLLHGVRSKYSWAVRSPEHIPPHTPSHAGAILEKTLKDKGRIYPHGGKKNQTDLGFHFGLWSYDLKEVLSKPQFPNL